jgi:hypothetical protein
MELGNVQIFFGKVCSVSDEMKICRCQIKIPGITEQLEPTDLPWYFPWYGLNYLPVIDDTVCVIVFDNNFSTAFYGRKIDLVNAGLDEGDYENYLEIFKRLVNDNQIQLTYKISTGIEFINGEVKTQLELEKYSMFCKANSMIMTEDRIDIGNKGLEAVIQGDKGVKELHDIIKHQANIITKMYEGFQKIIAGCTTPFTAPIAAQLSGFIPTQAQLKAENSKVDKAADTIQSKMVFTNE